MRDSSSRPPSASTSARASASPSPVDEPPDTPRSKTCGTSSSGTPAPGVGDLDEPRLPSHRARRERDRAAAVAERVVQQRADRLPDAGGRDPGQQPVGQPHLEGAARRRAGCGRHSSTTGASPSRRSISSAPAARAARAASRRSSSTRGELLGLLQRGDGLAAGVGIGVGGQLVEAQLQRGDPAAQLVGDVADQLALALDQLGERGGGGVEHVGDAVELGDAVPARGGAEVARAEPGRAVGDAAQRLGQPPGGDGGDDRARRHRQHARAAARPASPGSARASIAERGSSRVIAPPIPNGSDSAHRVLADVHADPPHRLAGLLQRQPPARRHGELRALRRGIDRALGLEAGLHPFEEGE